MSPPTEETKDHDDHPAAQKIADRIKKLLALATSANPHEAAQAAAEAQRLMVEHDLSEACLEEGPGPVVEYVVQESDGSSRACMWRASLADKLGEAMGVKVLYTVGSSRLRSFGRSADVAARAGRRASGRAPRGRRTPAP